VRVDIKSKLIFSGKRVTIVANNDELAQLIRIRVICIKNLLFLSNRVAVSEGRLDDAATLVDSGVLNYVTKRGLYTNKGEIAS